MKLITLYQKVEQRILEGQGEKELVFVEGGYWDGFKLTPTRSGTIVLLYPRQEEDED